MSGTENEEESGTGEPEVVGREQAADVVEELKEHEEEAEEGDDA